MKKARGATSYKSKSWYQQVIVFALADNKSPFLSVLFNFQFLILKLILIGYGNIFNIPEKVYDLKKKNK